MPKKTTVAAKGKGGKRKSNQEEVEDQEVGEEQERKPAAKKKNPSKIAKGDQLTSYPFVPTIASLPTLQELETNMTDDVRYLSKKASSEARTKETARIRSRKNHLIRKACTKFIEQIRQSQPLLLTQDVQEWMKLALPPQKGPKGSFAIRDQALRELQQCFSSQYDGTMLGVHNILFGTAEEKEKWMKELEKPAQEKDSWPTSPYNAYYHCKSLMSGQFESIKHNIFAGKEGFPTQQLMILKNIPVHIHLAILETYGSLEAYTKWFQSVSLDIHISQQD